MTAEGRCKERMVKMRKGNLQTKCRRVTYTLKIWKSNKAED